MSGESLTLSTTATLPAVRLLSAALRGALFGWPLTEERRMRLELALVEAATNVARHAYRDLPPGPVTLVLSRDGANLSLSVKDRGRPFDPHAVPAPPEPDPEDPTTWPEGGMGLPIIRSACDELRYASVDGENTLTLLLHAPELCL